jgi:hypothetical protein
VLSINAYYNGHDYVPLDISYPKKNQKIIITLLEDFVPWGKEKPFRKYVGKLQPECASEMMGVLTACEKVGMNER